MPFPEDNVSGAQDKLARGMDSAADAIHERAQRLPGGDRIVDAAHSAAQSIENAADYVRDQDLGGMISDVRRMAMRHPGATLIIVGALGYMLMRSLSRH